MTDRSVIHDTFSLERIYPATPSKVFAAFASAEAKNAWHATSEHELGAAFAEIAQVKAGSVVVGADSFFITLRDQIVALAARYIIPTTYETRESVAAGGLMSYAPNFRDAYRQVGVYVGRILKGEKAADLPILQPTKFELVINLKTAKTLGLDVPLSFQQRADEIIE